MTNASRWLRRAEISLWLVGISLLGVALGATLSRWHYQSKQERALLQRAALEMPADLPAQSAPANSDAALVSRSTLDEIPPNTIELEWSDLAEEPQVAGTEATTGQDVPEIPRQPKAPAQRAVADESDADADPAAIGRIEIPRLGVAAVVREGADEETLSRAVGLIPGAAHPGQSGNVVLAGHRDTFFRPLRKIKVNDRIRLVVPPNTFEYRVESTRVVTPDETSVLQSKGLDELTLVTCYPFRFIGSAPDRFIVSATRVN